MTNQYPYLPTIIDSLPKKMNTDREWSHIAALIQ